MIIFIIITTYDDKQIKPSMKVAKNCILVSFLDAIFFFVVSGQDSTTMTTFLNESLSYLLWLWKFNAVAATAAGVNAVIVVVVVMLKMCFCFNCRCSSSYFVVSSLYHVLLLTVLCSLI